MAVLLAMGAVACGTRAEGPPTIVVDRSACSHCSMLISEPRYAAAYRAAGAEARVFDDIGCLRSALKTETRKDLHFWFHDAIDGRWIEGTDATFVSSPEIQTPMNGGLLAYRNAAAANEAAAKYRGQVLKSLQDLLTTEEGS